MSRRVPGRFWAHNDSGEPVLFATIDPEEFVDFQATRQGHVPGYPILSLGSSYGIRWSFDN